MLLAAGSRRAVTRRCSKSSRSTIVSGWARSIAVRTPPAAPNLVAELERIYGALDSPAPAAGDRGPAR